MSKRNITVTAVKRDPPDLDQFVAALLVMATERLKVEREEKRREGAPRPGVE